MLMPQHEEQGGTNHPLAWRMCAIMFISYNLTLGGMMGTFSLLVPAVEAKLNVTRVLSSLGVSLVFLGLSLAAPVIGTLAQKVSLRRMIMTGATMGLVGYVILALSQSIWLDLAAYALLFGPGLSLTATVLPPTLVTRWFHVNRGRALGITTSTLLMAFIPLVAAKILQGYGLSATYWALAALMAALLVPLSFVVDYPPDAVNNGGNTAPQRTAAEGGMSIKQLLGNARFWALSVSSAAVIAGATILSAHFVPMVEGWGIDSTRAAALLTASSLAGMVGAIAVGWLADKIGGPGAVVLLCIANGLLWGALLLHPTYIALIAIAALLGVFGASVVPAFGVALSQQFGEATFSRAFGLGMLIALPFSFFGTPLFARVYTVTNSYADALIGLVILFIFATLLASTTLRRSEPKVTVPAE